MYKSKINSIISHFKINQTVFAEKTGISKAYLSEIINGKVKSLSADKVKAICKAFNVSAEWFLFGEDNFASLESQISIKLESLDQLEDIRDSIKKFDKPDSDNKVHIQFCLVSSE